MFIIYIILSFSGILIQNNIYLSIYLHLSISLIKNFSQNLPTISTFNEPFLYLGPLTPFGSPNSPNFLG